MDAIDQAHGLRRMVGVRRGAQPLRVIAITSGKGGVGKTSFAANMALVAAGRGLRVLVIDADVGLANVEILYGLNTRRHLGHALTGQVPLSEVIAVGPRGVEVLPSGAGVQDQYQFGDQQRLALLSSLEDLSERYDVVLVDCGAGIGDNVVFFSSAAQEAVLVVSPEPTALSDAYAAVKALSQSGTGRFRVVVSMVPSDDAARRVFDRLTQVTSRFLTAHVSYLGWLPKDENVARAIRAQRPAVESFPHAPYTRGLSVIADALLAEGPPEPLDGGLKLLWQRLLREQGAGGR
jgi:flagellar biosynthesis protein FlhG